MTGKVTEADFKRRLAEQFTGQKSPNPGMVLNTPPSGTSKSLEEMFKTDQVAVSSSDNLNQSGIQDLEIDLIDESPYQPRIKIDESSLLALANMMEDNGQQEPILVRRKANGRYELISGHRRRRAGKLKGWKYIKGIVEDLDDRAAELKTLTSNEQHETLTDFERARAYKQALDHGLATSQTAVARMFGCTQGRVSQCLSMLNLPEPFVNLLTEYPGLFGYRFASEINSLCHEFPDKIDKILEGVRQLIDKENFTGSDLRDFISDKKEVISRSAPSKPITIPNSDGQVMFSMTRKNQSIIVNIKDLSLDPEEINKEIFNFLRAKTK